MKLYSLVCLFDNATAITIFLSIYLLEYEKKNWHKFQRYIFILKCSSRYIFSYSCHECITYCWPLLQSFFRLYVLILYFKNYLIALTSKKQYLSDDQLGVDPIIRRALMYVLVKITGIIHYNDSIDPWLFLRNLTFE